MRSPDAIGSTSAIRDLFDVHLSEGLHEAAQLSVFRDGEPVLDLAGGTADGEPVTTEDRFVLFCALKPALAVAVHQLIEEGELAYEDRVREHWPAYAEPGTKKAETTVRDVLGHRMGFPNALATRSDLWSDWDAAVETIAAIGDDDLRFDPGETAAYHTQVWGYVLGELVRRVTGTHVDRFVEERVFDPLGMDATSFGLAPDEVDDAPNATGYEALDRAETVDIAPQFDRQLGAMAVNQTAVRRADVPPSGALGTAHELARFYACLANGGELDGTRLLAPETVASMTAVETATENDLALDRPRRTTLGLERAGPVESFFGYSAPGSAFGHVGLNAVAGWGDPAEDLAVAYVTTGIRCEYEYSTRFGTMADAIRGAFRGDAPTTEQRSGASSGTEKGAETGVNEPAP